MSLYGKDFSTNIKDIGLEDLLKKTNKLEYKKVKNFLKNQTVLITGAGGSIGMFWQRLFLSLI